MTRMVIATIVMCLFVCLLAGLLGKIFSDSHQQDSAWIGSAIFSVLLPLRDCLLLAVGWVQLVFMRGFRSNFRAVSEKFRRSFREVSEKFRSGLGVIYNRSRLGAVWGQFRSSFWSHLEAVSG